MRFQLCQRSDLPRATTRTGLYAPCGIRALPGSMAWVCVWLLAALCSAGLAQEGRTASTDSGGAASTDTLVSIADYWLMTADQRVGLATLDLDCTVLLYDPEWGLLWVRDETGGMYIHPGARPLPIKAGQQVRITGPVQRLENNLSLADATIVVRGEGPLRSVPLGDFREFNPQLSDRLVWTQGLVDRQTTSATDRTHLRLFLTVDGRLVVAWIVLEAGTPIPNFVGSIVQVTGIYNPTPKEPGPITSLQLMVPGLERVEPVGQLATDERFRRHAVPITRLRDLPPDALVRVVGEVSAQQPGRSLVIRDATGQVEVVTTQTQLLAVHDPVEAIGRPSVIGIETRLEGALYRKLETGSAAAAGGQAPAAGALQLAASILELSPDEAEAARPAQITGVVTWAHPDYPYLFIQDSSGGVRVRRADDPTAAGKTERTVRATGVTAMGRFAPELVADRLERVGVAALPDAPMISLEHALTGAEEAQWVAMRGFFRAVESRTNELGLIEQVLHLATASGDFEAQLPTTEDLSAMLGAVLRLRGVCTARADSSGKLTGIQLRVNDASFLQIEEPPPADVFHIPARSLESLGRFGATQAFNRRVKVEGTVMYAAPGRFVLHDGGVSVLAFTREAELPRPGDRLETVGFLGRLGPRVILRESVFRRLGAGGSLQPTELHEFENTNEALDGQLVRVAGSVLDVGSVGSAQVLTVQHEGAVFSAHLAGAAAPVSKGAEVELTGVYDVQFDEYGHPRAFALLLRTPADLVVTRPPSPFTAQRVLTFTAFLALGTAVVVGWVVALRRRVQRQTEQIRAQLEREGHLQRELERAQRLESLGLLAGGIAHDFNNLLTVVMGNVSLARIDPGIDEETRQNLADAERAVSRARDLTQQLLTFSKGGAPLRAAVDLAGVVREVAEFILHGSPVRAEFRVAPDLWPADVDKGQVGQVVQNIVINGVQAMPEGGCIELDLANEVVRPVAGGTLAPGRYVRLDIQDHGRGISPADIPRIFDPYFTTKRQGSGLGLATVYSIVKRHGGDVAVDSRPGVGSRFTVWLPAADATAPLPERGPPAAAVEASVAAGSRSGAEVTGPTRILIMDDEPAIRKLSQTILRRAGYDVTAVGDGAEAVREYEAAMHAGRRYAVVIFDLTVPGGMGGRQALEELRRIDPAVRAIVSSGYSSDPSIADHRELGFAATVAKPYEVAALLQTVQAVVRDGAM